MADVITSTAADTQTGHYTYLEIEHWTRRDGTEIVGFYERIWHHSQDEFTRISQRRLPAQPAKGFDLNQIGYINFDHVPSVISEYEAGESLSFVESGRRGRHLRLSRCAQ